MYHVFFETETGRRLKCNIIKRSDRHDNLNNVIKQARREIIA